MRAPFIRLITILTILGLLFGSWGSGTARAAIVPTELFISEYIEGSSNNKAIEIYNGTGSAVDLAAGSYNLKFYFNGAATAGTTINLTGSVASGDVYVVADNDSAAAILAVTDQQSTASFFNGNDAVALYKGTTLIDVIGQIGFNPGTEWGTGLVSTADNTLIRKGSVTGGDTNGSDVFDPSIQWDGFATNTFVYLGWHDPAETAPTVVSTNPANGGTIHITSNLTVTFSEPVNVSGDWFMIDCNSSVTRFPVDTVVSGGPTTFTIDPNTDFSAFQPCLFNIEASFVTDQDSSDPPDTMVDDFQLNFIPLDFCQEPYTHTYEIQGSGATTPLPGTVTTMGVVIGDYEVPGGSGQVRGFFIQDQSGDGNAATSDGLFIYNGGTDSVALGDLVRVTGTASEYQGQTQVSTQVSGGEIIQCGTGSITPVEVSLPFPSAEYPERFEGMLVFNDQELTVTEHYQLGRFGEVLLSSGGRLFQPTSLFLPGSDEAIGLQAANDLSQVLIDDASNVQNPDPILFGRGGNPLSAANTLRGGDTVTYLSGVFTYSWGGASASPNAWRIRVVNAMGAVLPNFTASNPRPTDLAAPEPGDTRVVGMNLLNYFNTFDGASSSPPYACNLGVGGALTDCRGADDLAEFNRQWPKTVAAMVEMDAAVYGIVEIENDGYGSTSAIQDLVDRLNNATTPGRFAFIDVDANTGQVNALGTDAIKVGFIYQPALVTPVGTTAVLNSVEFVNGGDSGPRNRPSLLQAFQAPDGAEFLVNVNHFKSKGSACDDPDAGDGQGNCNIVRTRAAEALAAWLATDPTGTGQPDLAILGDLNSYAMEDPIIALENAGFRNEIIDDLNNYAYSYVFDGQWGYLDHALVTMSLDLQGVDVQEFHINADEPSVLDYNVNFKSAGQQLSLYAADLYRISDHDPVVLDLELDSQAPDTFIDSHPDDPTASATASFSFSSDDGAATFECSLDGAAFTACPSPQAYTGLVNGLHTFEVRAVDFHGNRDETPASFTWHVDLVPPEVVSILATSINPAMNGPVFYRVSFSEDVTGVGLADFSLSLVGLEGAVITEVSGTGRTYMVEVQTGPGTGTLRLDIPPAAAIVDLAGHPLGGLPFTGGDVYVVNPSTFADVPMSHWAWAFIEQLYGAGITTGCGTNPLVYCPQNPVTRAQMAVFLERGVHYPAPFTPPAGTGLVFTDVPAGYWAVNWIEKLFADGITTGCLPSPLRYCPEDPVTRAQMAVFLLRAEHGVGYMPPAATGIFSDVPAGHWAAAWIEQLFAEGITTGCSNAPLAYCPEDTVNRAQMAVFLVRTFVLP